MRVGMFQGNLFKEEGDLPLVHSSTHFKMDFSSKKPNDIKLWSTVLEIYFTPLPPLKFRKTSGAKVL
jgi:hypothetical protein